MRIHIKRKGNRVWVESSDMPKHYTSGEFPAGDIDIVVKNSCVPLISQSQGRMRVYLSQEGRWPMDITMGHLAATRDQAKEIFNELKESFLFFVSCKKKLGRAIFEMAAI